ncbi:ubiquitin ligase (cullin) of SCF [Coemansia sp. RSA 2705]|nr:ubiquitin ligase (cullin) of SCF [Coemansia sp. RSA 2705]
MPMIRFPDDVDSDEFLDVLQQALDPFVVEKQYMSRAEYMAVFMAVCRFQGRPQPTRAEMANAAQSTDIRLPPSRDQQLYDWIIDYTDRVFSKLAVQMRQLSGSKLLESYIEEWKHFQRMHRLVCRLFYKVDQNWVERERRYNPSCTTVSSTLIQLWYTCMFKPISTHLMANAIWIINRVRDCSNIDASIVVNLYNSLVELAPEDMDGLRVLFRKDLGVYIRHYENPYIAAAIAYIDQRVCSLRKHTSMREYIGVLSELLTQEEQRSEVYLHPESLNPAKYALNLQFLVREVDQIYQMAGAMLEAGDDRDGLRIIYSLLKRFDGSDTLQTLQRKFISSAESDILQGCPQRPTNADSRNSDFTLTAVDYFDGKLDTYKATIHGLFQGDSNYIAALEKAFARVINSLAAKRKLATRPSRLAAEYCNLVLSKNKLQLTGPGNDTKQAVPYLCKAMQIVHAYNDKDEFFAYYKRFLAHRLLNDASISTDLEEAAISDIYITENANQTLNPEVMAIEKSDIQIMLAEVSMSNEYSCKFAQQYPGLGFGMDVKILAHDQWAGTFKSHGAHLAFPPVLTMACNLYAQFYKQTHKGRTLQWQWAISRATVQLYFPESTSRFAESGYTIVVNVYQLVILELLTDSLAFKNATALTHSQIRFATSMSIERVEQELNVMAKHGILQYVAGGTKVQINNKFNSEHSQIDISQSMATQEKDEVENSILAHRISYLRADIALIMKKHKRMMYSELFMRVWARP